MNGYKDALEDMVWQFAHRGTRDKKPMLYTGGLSALEYAFGVLGWEDPHYISDKDAQAACCDIEGCYEFIEAQTHWGVNETTGLSMYTCLCSEHFKQQYEGITARPPMKLYALERENSRDNKGILPARRG